MSKVKSDVVRIGAKTQLVNLVKFCPQSIKMLHPLHPRSR